MKRLFFIFLISSVAFSTKALNTDSIKKTSPKIGGTIRAKYEYNTSLNAHRFQVRNARFGVTGHFSAITSYKAEIDLSDEGVTKMLDAYVRIQPMKWFRFTMGQQKIPFGTDNLRSPHQRYFANRSFVGKQLVSGLRDVGATVMFTNRRIVPFDFQAGIYNGDGLYHQRDWQESMNYAFRMEVFPMKNAEISLNYNSIRPEDIRMNLIDVGAYINFGKLHLEGEYIYKMYENNIFPTTTSYSMFAAYDIPLSGIAHLSKITPLIRFDSMSDNNKGKKAKSGIYEVDDIGRKRITGGITFSLSKPFLNDIRLNYEKYFYADPGMNKDDKLVVEFIVRF